MSIEGIKLSITSAELKKLCEARVEYHSTRARWNETKLKELKPTFDQATEDAEDEAEEQFKAMTYANNGNNNDPLDRFKRGARHHRDRAVVFRFTAAHVIENETYILTEEDLRKLEVLPRY